MEVWLLGTFFPVLSDEKFVSSQLGFLALQLSVPPAVLPNRPQARRKCPLAPFGTFRPRMSQVPVAV